MDFEFHEADPTPGHRMYFDKTPIVADGHIYTEQGAFELGEEDYSTRLVGDGGVITGPDGQEFPIGGPDLPMNPLAELIHGDYLWPDEPAAAGGAVPAGTGWPVSGDPGDFGPGASQGQGSAEREAGDSSGVAEPREAGASAGKLVVEYRGQDFVVGDPNEAPTGVPVNSVTISNSNGTRVLSDLDGDGRVDYVSFAGTDGNWSAWRWLTPGDNYPAGPAVDHTMITWRDGSTTEHDARGERYGAPEGYGERGGEAEQDPTLDALRDAGYLPGDGEEWEPIDSEPRPNYGYSITAATRMGEGGSYFFGGLNPAPEGETPAERQESGSATPEGGNESWDSGHWECVQRGGWG